MLRRRFPDYTVNCWAMPTLRRLPPTVDRGDFGPDTGSPAALLPWADRATLPNRGSPVAYSNTLYQKRLDVTLPHSARGGVPGERGMRIPMRVPGSDSRSASAGSAHLTGSA